MGVPMRGCRKSFTAYQHLIGKWGVWIIIAKSLTPVPFLALEIKRGSNRSEADQSPFPPAPSMIRENAARRTVLPVDTG